MTPDTNNITNRLDELSTKTIETYFNAFTIVLIIVIGLRLWEGNYFHASICIACMLAIIGIRFFNGAGYEKNSLTFFCFFTSICLGAIAVYGTESKLFSIGMICLHMASFVVVLRSKTLRTIHIGSCLAIVILSFHNLGMALVEYTPFILVFLAFSLVFLFFVEFLESQDLALGNALKEAKQSAEKLSQLNQTLLSNNYELKTYNQIMSHDLKAPLRTISSFSSLLRRRVDFKEEKHEEYFQFIETSAKRMDCLINELLLFHNLDEGGIGLKMVSLSTELNKIMKSHKSHLGEVKISINKDELPDLYCNQVFVNIVLSNLISNGLKYQPANSESHVPEISVWANELANATEVYVKDNGIGIEKNYVKDLFKPFKRFHNESTYEGTGLGLPICQKVMEKLNGSIQLVESSNSGTTFKLSFPQINQVAQAG